MKILTDWFYPFLSSQFQLEVTCSVTNGSTENFTNYNCTMLDTIIRNMKSAEKCHKCRLVKHAQNTPVKWLRTILYFFTVVQNNAMHNTNSIHASKISAQGSPVGIPVVLASVEPHNSTIF